MNRCSQCGKELTLTSEIGVCTECRNKQQTYVTPHVCVPLVVQTGSFITSYCPVCGKIIDVHPVPFVDLNQYRHDGGASK